MDTYTKTIDKDDRCDSIKIYNKIFLYSISTDNVVD